MVRVITIIVAFFVVDIANANCELSWIADWEAGKNWLHTTALSGDISRGYQPGRKFRYSPSKSQPKITRKVLQIEKITEKSLSVVCEGIELTSCPIVSAIEFNGQACNVDSEKVKQVVGSKADDIGERTSDQYARQTLVNCLGQSFKSDIV